MIIPPMVVMIVERFGPFDDFMKDKNKYKQRRNGSKTEYYNPGTNSWVDWTLIAASCDSSNYSDYSSPSYDNSSYDSGGYDSGSSDGGCSCGD